MDIIKLATNTIRVIGNEAINKANSGHPGMVLSSAGISTVLFTKFLNITNKDPKWINRDRFVLGSGHASMLLYTNLHLLGYKISIDDIKAFRQLGSITPGHPEYNHTEGIDCTSGPLGQGIGHAVGMAMAEKFLAEQFNKEDIKIFDNYTYCLCGDGDIEEGASFESMSLASRLNLNKLIVIYDCNDVTLDGPLSLTSNENLNARFKAMNWNVLEVNGLDEEEVEKAIKKAKKFKSQPTIIIAHSIIGFGSSKQGDCATHGSPLKEDIINLKNNLDWHYNEFEIPTEVKEYYDEVSKKNLKSYRKWKKKFKEYKMKYPFEFNLIEKAINRDYKDIKFPTFDTNTNEATRVSMGKVINYIAKDIKTLIGGSADVAKSVNTLIKDENKFGLEEKGRNVFYGIREFGMSLAQSGMLLYGIARPYIGCFLVFSDYLKPSIRTAALMNIPSINIFTHDSIAVGEDGPTHQPIEQINSLRIIPNTITFRPSGAIETAHAMKYAINNTNGPVNIILSRQAMQTIDVSYENYIKGAYVVNSEVKDYKLTILATGSEVDLAIKTANYLKENNNINIRVVSITSLELFEKQGANFKTSIINNRDNTIALEMGNSSIWYKYASNVYGINCFGASGKDKDVLKSFGFDVNQFAEYLLYKLK